MTCSAQGVELALQVERTRLENEKLSSEVWGTPSYNM